MHTCAWQVTLATKGHFKNRFKKGMCIPFFKNNQIKTIFLQNLSLKIYLHLLVTMSLFLSHILSHIEAILSPWYVFSYFIHFQN